MIILGDGTKVWATNGNLHREGGPAVEYTDGTKKWYKNGVLHREDGPAVEGLDGHKEWYINDEKYTKDEFVLLQFTKGIITNE